MKVKCPDCEGEGKRKYPTDEWFYKGGSYGNRGYEDCRTCGGTGEVDAPDPPWGAIVFALVVLAVIGVCYSIWNVGIGKWTTKREIAVPVVEKLVEKPVEKPPSAPPIVAQPSPSKPVVVRQIPDWRPGYYALRMQTPQQPGDTYWVYCKFPSGSVISVETPDIDGYLKATELVQKLMDEEKKKQVK